MEGAPLAVMAEVVRSLRERQRADFSGAYRVGPAPPGPTEGPSYQKAGRWVTVQRYPTKPQ